MSRFTFTQKCMKIEQHQQHNNIPSKWKREKKTNKQFNQSNWLRLHIVSHENKWQIAGLFPDFICFDYLFMTATIEIQSNNNKLCFSDKWYIEWIFVACIIFSGSGAYKHTLSIVIENDRSFLVR